LREDVFRPRAVIGEKKREHAAWALARINTRDPQ
jgi:hypothetical protein